MSKLELVIGVGGSDMIALRKGIADEVVRHGMYRDGSPCRFIGPALGFDPAVQLVLAIREVESRYASGQLRGLHLRSAPLVDMTLKRVRAFYP